MEILLIRHGEPEADILNVREGRADSSLTEMGRKQVQLMVERVRGVINYLLRSFFCG